MSDGRLRRRFGLAGATLTGLGSILGTGIFVSVGIAAGVAGPAVVLAVAVAAVVAACNGLSSAQLAATHPVSGGTYEYGYRLLHPSLGFTAGWLFLAAKSASAATAALGFAGYALNLGGGPDDAQVPLAVAAVVLVTVLVFGGASRGTTANAAVVLVTVLALLAFVLAGLPTALREGPTNLAPFFDPADGFFEACALMFVAYTGYGRIATLGEEVREPRRTIPRAIVLTLLVSAALYAAVALVAVAAAGSAELAGLAGERAAPLETVAGRFGVPGVGRFVAVGAVTAMLGVLLNLVLGLSRVALAMGRRGDLPSIFGRLDRSGESPSASVLLVGALVVALALLGDVRLTWSFSAFTVLIYYALTNLAALRLRPGERLYHPLVAWCGLGSCVFLAFRVEPAVWAGGLGLIGVGLVWHRIARRPGRAAPDSR